MNIMEAIESGKPFKRWRHPAYIYIHDPGGHLRYLDHSSEMGLFLTASDLLAEDWELLEPQVTITTSLFWEAWRNTVNCEGAGTGAIEALARRLGLEK